MKLPILVLIAFIFNTASISAAEMPPAWPWHGVSIQNTEPFDPADLEKIATTLHINSIQIRLLPRRLGELQKISADAAWTQSLDWGNKMLDQCKRLGLVASLTLEGGYPLDSTQPLISNSKEFWYGPKHLDEAVQSASKLSAFFAKRGSELVAYQMLSEPLIYEGKNGLAPPQWRGLMERIITTIRLHDATRWIAVAPPPGGGPNMYKGFEPFKSPRIIYGAHMYIPQAFTHQGILLWKDNFNTYPGRIDATYWDKQALKNIMSPLRDFQNHNQVPVWIGEFGSITWAAGGEQYLLDLVSIFDEWNWGWTYFSINGYYGWSPDYDNIRPEPMSTWPQHKVGGTSLRWRTLKKATGS